MTQSKNHQSAHVTEGELHMAHCKAIQAYGNIKLLTASDFKTACGHVGCTGDAPSGKDLLRQIRRNLADKDIERLHRFASYVLGLNLQDPFISAAPERQTKISADYAVTLLKAREAAREAARYIPRLATGELSSASARLGGKRSGKRGETLYQIRKHLVGRDSDRLNRFASFVMGLNPQNRDVEYPDEPRRPLKPGRKYTGGASAHEKAEQRRRLAHLALQRLDKFDNEQVRRCYVELECALFLEPDAASNAEGEIFEGTREQMLVNIQTLLDCCGEERLCAFMHYVESC
jgi:hypothetical protein